MMSKWHMWWISEWFALHCVCQNDIARSTVYMYVSNTYVSVTWSILNSCLICCMYHWLLWLSTQWCFLIYVLHSWSLHTNSTVSIQTLVCTLLSIRNYGSVINYIRNGNCDIYHVNKKSDWEWELHATILLLLIF